MKSVSSSGSSLGSGGDSVGGASSGGASSRVEEESRSPLELLYPISDQEDQEREEEGVVSDVVPAKN